VFKTYDIRGIYPNQINEELAYKVGRGYAQFLKNLLKKDTLQVVVGRDMRFSSPALQKYLIEGLKKEGCVVYNLGLCTTPLVSFAVCTKKFDGGVMVSASHNPKEYNAFKIIKYPMLQLGLNNGLLDIERNVENMKDVKIPLLENKKEDNILNIFADYENHLYNIFKNNYSNLKVVVDYGNGVGSVSATPIYKKLEINTIDLYANPDGEFPNHPANPHELSNFKQLQQQVKESQADLGIFFDGDADRAVFVDNEGEIINTDLLFCMLCNTELKNTDSINKYGNKVYYDLRFTKEIYHVIKSNGGDPYMMQVGNPFYKEKLSNNGGLMAAEFSGHIMYNQNYGIDDGLFATLKVLDILSVSKDKISNLIKKYKTKYNTPEINIEVKEDPEMLMNKISTSFADGESINLDGVYIQYKNWWFSLRRSNTEPLLRLRIEADTLELLEEKKEKILQLIQS